MITVDQVFKMRSSNRRMMLVLLSLFLILNNSFVTAFLHPSSSSSSSFRLKQKLNYKNKDISNDDNGPIEYNDFNFEAGDDDHNNNNNDNFDSLKTRFEEVYKEKRLNDAILAQNWRRGNWNVRGFSLDRYNPIDDIQKNENDEENNNKNDNKVIDISHLSSVTTTSLLNDDNNNDSIAKEEKADDNSNENEHDEENNNRNGKVIDISHLSLVTTTTLLNDDDNDSITKEGDDIVVVGRTDGSVIMVEVGTQYWTKFDSKMTAKMTGDSTMSVESQLVRDDASRDNEMTENNFIAPNDNDVPFEVLHQFTTPNKQEITSLLPIENNNDHDDHSYTIVTGDIEGNVMIYDITGNNNQEEATIKPRDIISTIKIHSKNIVALKLVTLNNEEQKMIVSVSSDGTVALWDLSSSKGKVVYRCRIDISVLQEEYNMDDTLMIHCADVFEDYLFLGLSTGHVLTYKVDEMMEQTEHNPMPNGKFLADTSGISPGITAIACGGKGRLDGSSVIIVTGSSDGTVKQWELLPRRRLSPEDQDSSTSATFSIADLITKIEHWPRLANQRMSKRAHLFPPGHTNSEGTTSAVTSLAYNHDIPSHFVSAGTDGTVRAWNSITGEELFVLDGFSSSAELCLTRNTLLTSGMKQFVCVHDFNVDINNVDKGFDLEW